MERWERLKMIMENEGLNKNSFSSALGINNNVTIGRIINEHREPSVSTCTKVIDAFPQYSLEWLLNGNGDMISVQQNPTNNTNHSTPYTTYLLPMSAMGGSLTGFANDCATLHNCEAIVSPIENVDFAITVYGESMAPEYPSGSRVLIKKFNPDLFIDWGRTYVLDTPNGVIIKEVHESEKPGYIRCNSINPDPKFKPFDVPLSEVFGMYKVLMCLAMK